MAVGFTFLSRLHWGGKVNAEIKDLMLAHAFKWAKRVWFHVGIDNIRSQKAMEKIGAKNKTHSLLLDILLMNYKNSTVHTTPTTPSMLAVKVSYEKRPQKPSMLRAYVTAQHGQTQH